MPVIDKKELASFERLTEKYNKMIEPSKSEKVIEKAETLVPESVKKAGTLLGEWITEQELYQQVLKLMVSGFKDIEERVSKYTISESTIIKNISKQSQYISISTIDEICLVRSYDIAKAISRNKDMNCLCAVIEGGITGVAGFWGLPFNLLFSLFFYFGYVTTNS